MNLYSIIKNKSFFAIVALLLAAANGYGREPNDNLIQLVSSNAPLAIERIVALPEPMIKTAPTTSEEDQALRAALAAYKTRKNSDDVDSLLDYRRNFPQSGWNAALDTNLGLIYLHGGFFSPAIESLNRAWQEGKDATGPSAHALIDRSVSELAAIYAGLGQMDKLAALFDQIAQRPISGSATEKIQLARDELSLAGKDPRHLYNCGTIALRALILTADPKNKKTDFLQYYKASENGTNLSELAALSAKAGVRYRVIFRSPDQPVPTPSIINWKIGHFGAIVASDKNRYHISDPIFAGDGYWANIAAVDSEGSGYYLIPANLPMQPGWRAASDGEAASIWGKGPSSGVQAGDNNDPSANGGPNKGQCPLCGYDIKEATVGVTLSDTPVGYIPPIGPAVKIQVTYNQREDSQPANFNFFNVSPKWTLNWLTYISDDPTSTGSNVSRFLPGGGAYYYSGYGAGTGRFSQQTDDGSVLVFESQSPVRYKRFLANGFSEIYEKSDGATTYPRRIFLSQIADAQGNSVTLNYDNQLRLLSLKDATGRYTTFSYNTPQSPLLVSKITDPFGRSASLTYDSNGRLSSITDIIGLTSSFGYDAYSLVNRMTTPYGTTSFAYTAPGASGPPRFVDVTDPLGNHEREEWVEPAPIADSDPLESVPQGMPITLTNQYLSYRNSFHWDKDQYIAAGCSVDGGCDYSKARVTHFAHVPNVAAMKSTTVESVKNSLENRIWYVYPGQTESTVAGSYSQPIAIGRVLDNGSTQLRSLAYDSSAFYKMTRATDPIGRRTTFHYPNSIDLSSITQETGSVVDSTIRQTSYNYQHRPITTVDAAGQLWVNSFNEVGELSSDTNPLGEANHYSYDSTWNLISVTNANGVTAGQLTYDSANRVATFTDSEGRVLAYSYDAADRLVKVVYPDGTAKSFVYDKLDLVSSTDRIGRVKTYSYDANRNLTSMVDPANQQTILTYTPNGKLKSRVDAKGNSTQWDYDVEGRLIRKTFADNSHISYAYETNSSRLKSTTDALGQVKTYSYANDDSVIGVGFSNTINPTPNVTFSYDPYFARVTSMTDGTGSTQYSYVPIGTRGALSRYQEIPPISVGAITYTYDSVGRVASRAISGSATETLGYDKLGRLASDANELGSFSMSYLGQTEQIVTRSLSSSSFSTSWTYLPNVDDRRLSSISSTGLSPGQVSTFQYGSNSEAQTTSETRQSDASISPPVAPFSQNSEINTLNQISATTESGAPAATLTYDLNGNLLSDGERLYSWDAENRLIKVSSSSVAGDSSTFVYDGLGRRTTITRISPASAASSTALIWCGTVLCQSRNSADNAIDRTYYDQGEYVAGAGGTAILYGLDQLGSVRRAFSNSSSPAYDYDPFGSQAATTRATDFGYAGMYQDKGTGLYLTLYRAYDAQKGRWLSRDPLGEVSDAAGNLYAYVEGNPVSLNDPLGLDNPGMGPYGTWDPPCSGGAGAAGTGLPEPPLQGSCPECYAPELAAVKYAAIAMGIDSVLTGVAGEAAVRSVYDIGGKALIFVNGRARIPDGISSTAVTEVKNVAYQSWTRQLQDYAQYAQDKGLQFQLFIREDTYMAQPLKDATDRGLVLIKRIPQ